jgi:hypothetical protein
MVFPNVSQQLVDEPSNARAGRLYSCNNLSPLQVRNESCAGVKGTHLGDDLEPRINWYGAKTFGNSGAYIFMPSELEP